MTIGGAKTSSHRIEKRRTIRDLQEVRKALLEYRIMRYDYWLDHRNNVTTCRYKKKEGQRIEGISKPRGRLARVGNKIIKNKRAIKDLAVRNKSSLNVTNQVDSKNLLDRVSSSSVELLTQCIRFTMLASTHYQNVSKQQHGTDIKEMDKNKEKPDRTEHGIEKSIELRVQRSKEEKRIEEEQAAKDRYWKIPVCYDDDDEEESSIPLKNIISELPPCVAITPDSPKMDSLIIEDEHLDTIPEMESDKLIKSSVEDLVQTPSESEDSSKGECDLPPYDDSSKNYNLTFSNPLFDIDEDFTSSDDHFPKEDFNSLFPTQFYREIDDVNLDPEGDTLFLESLLYDNSSPRPPKEFNSENPTASFSPSPIPIEDSDSLMEEIDIFLHDDDSIPPDKDFNHGVLASKEKSPSSPSHWGFKASKIVQVIKTFWELGHEHKFITEIMERRANDCIVSITEPDYKNLNKNDIEDMYLLIMNNKKEKRVMRPSEIHKFCDATLRRTLEGLKSYYNDVKYGYVQKELTNDEVEFLKLFEEEMEVRLNYQDKMRRWEMYVNGRPLGPRRERPE
ncbi:hypothetical protein Tco_0458431 [Tanacetum coccineum]